MCYDGIADESYGISKECEVMKKWRNIIAGVLTAAMVVFSLSGCAGKETESGSQENAADNVIITETGETLVQEQPTEEPEATASPEAQSDLPAPDVVPEEMPQEPEQEQVISEEDQIESKGGHLQIVFLGDSIFDNSRDGTGIPYLTSEACNADCYNLAIGGTCAAIELDEKYENDQWTSRSLVGIVKAMRGDIPTDIFNGTRAGEILSSGNVDFSKTDYFVVEYGMNDLLRATPMSNSDNDFDIRTYVGALRYAVSNLKELAPDATVILCGPNYAMFYSGDKFIGDGNTLNTGYGTLFDYKGSCEYVAKEQGAQFFDAYLDLGIDGYTADEYLEDGVHLTEAGRKLYADALSKMILSIEETKNN